MDRRLCCSKPAYTFQHFPDVQSANSMGNVMPPYHQALITSCNIDFFGLVVCAQRSFHILESLGDIMCCTWWNTYSLHNFTSRKIILMWTGDPKYILSSEKHSFYHSSQDCCKYSTHFQAREVCVFQEIAPVCTCPPTSSVSNHYIPLTHTVPAQWLRSPLRLSQRSAPKS